MPAEPVPLPPPSKRRRRASRSVAAALAAPEPLALEQMPLPPFDTAETFAIHTLPYREQDMHDQRYIVDLARRLQRIPMWCYLLVPWRYQAL